MKSFQSFFLSLVAILFAACHPQVPTGIFERTVLLSSGDAGSKYFRIPAVATAADGSVVAVCDKRINSLWDLPNDIDVACLRSEDLGRTWSEAVTIAGADTTTGYGDAALVLDEQRGNLLCLMASGNGFWQSDADNYARLMVSASQDNGQTWEEPRDITSQIYGPDCNDSLRSKWYGAFISSGSALQLRDGRIMAVMPTRTKPVRGDSISCYVIYSDDGGESWQVSKTPGDRYGDEAKVVELENGDILMSVRNRMQGSRRFSLSHDRGETWSEPYEQPDIIEPACNGDMIRYCFGNKSFLLHSVPYHKESRENVTLLASFDEGKTWPFKRTLVAGHSAYSSLTVLPDGTIGCFVEEGDYEVGFQMVFYRLSPDWLLSDSER